MRILSFLIGLILLITPVSVWADQVRFSFNYGLTSAGTVSGGSVFVPEVSYSFRLSEHIELDLIDRVLITGVFYRNPGIVNHGIVAFGYLGELWFLTFGISADIFHTVLCGANAFCNKVGGITPGAHVSGGGYYGRILQGRLGAKADVHLSWVVAGAVYQGPIWSINIGPIVRLGDIETK